MISLFHSCRFSILSRTGNFTSKSSSSGCSSPAWKTCLQHRIVRTMNFELLTRFRVQFYSSKKSCGGSSRKKKLDPKSLMKDDEEAFFVVRKGDLVGVYKSLSDCQAQVGTSICDRPVSVYKGYSMSKDTEKYLMSCGLRNTLYSIRASDLTNDLFGTLVNFPLQPSSSGVETSSDLMTNKKPEEAPWSDSAQKSCTLEFDGASKGNPGPAGAGAILRSDDGSLTYRLRQGLGKMTNNMAEYRAFILGMKFAHGKGFTDVRVLGDSKLICMQMQGLWKVRNENISIVYEEAKILKDKFVSFQISHILRDLNSEADVQANLAVNLADGEIQEDIDK